MTDEADSGPIDEDADLAPITAKHRWQVRLRRWLARPKLWDDVFTRTVANILSISFLAGIAAVTGFITIPTAAWVVIGAVLMIIVLGLISEAIEKRHERKYGPKSASDLALNLFVAGFWIIVIGVGFYLFKTFD